MTFLSSCRGDHRHPTRHRDGWRQDLLRGGAKGKTTISVHWDRFLIQEKGVSPFVLCKGKDWSRRITDLRMTQSGRHSVVESFRWERLGGTSSSTNPLNYKSSVDRCVPVGSAAQSPPLVSLVSWTEGLLSPFLHIDRLEDSEQRYTSTGIPVYPRPVPLPNCTLSVY